ncbi:hypothetical protein [Micromonospora sp. NPDC049497]|uniref:hypothetical protein n=1 Tax=Micromonospora sp. NPDC049497 TaxID=3364273 RepID=UPI0037B51C2A
MSYRLRRKRTMRWFNREYVAPVQAALAPAVGLQTGVRRPVHETHQIQAGLLLRHAAPQPFRPEPMTA